MKKTNDSPLRKYVRTKEDKDTEKLERTALEWISVSVENRLAYEIDWLGVPIIQTPEEMVLMQELIRKVQPDYIIETGVAHGGSLIFYASIMELIGKGNVIGIDIDIREHNRKVIEAHSLFKRITLIEGSSVSQDVITRVRNQIPMNSKVIVCLDSNHYKEHVLNELNLYKSFVPVHSYIVVCDTLTSRMAEFGVCDKSYVNNGPKEAVEEFLRENVNFQIDRTYNRLFVSYSPDGYLKRIK